MKIYIFECSSATYLDCLEKSVFGSNRPWPLQIKKGEYCLLNHYEVGMLFGIWQASADGGKNIVPKAWGGRFPFQANVVLASTAIVEIPKAEIAENLLNADTGRLDNLLEGNNADILLQSLRKHADI